VAAKIRAQNLTWGHVKKGKSSVNNMGRRQSSAILERKFNQAKAREAFLKTRVPSTSTTVRKKQNSTYVYNSYMLTDATGNSSQFLVTASKAAVDKFGGATALGLVDPSTVAIAIPQKPKVFTPAKVNAMAATATPTARTTSWGTRVIKYSAATGGTSQAHFSAPISGDVTSTYKEVAQRSGAVYNAIKTSLGDADYHRYWFSPEQINIQEN
jgi:hypothetical protein